MGEACRGGEGAGEVWVATFQEESKVTEGATLRLLWFP